MTEMLYRGAGKAREVQKEIELEADTSEGRALSLAADLLLAAKASPKHAPMLVGMAARRLVKHWPHALRGAL